MEVSTRSTRQPADWARYTWLPVLGGISALSAEYHEHAFVPHTHDTFAIGVFDAGAASVRCEARSHTVSVDDVLVINPGAVHSAGSASSDGWWYRAFYPSVELVSTVLEESGRRVPRYFASAKVTDPILAADLRRIFARLESDSDPLGLEELAVTAIHRLWDHASLDSPGEPRITRADPGLGRARAHIEANGGEPMSLASLAEEAGMSRFHFIRAFTARYGLTPYAYLLQHKVRRACRLLERGERPIRVAMECGFSDQSHLTRHFKRVVGVTPGEYAAGAVRARSNVPRHRGNSSLLSTPPCPC
jgi:AraC-like DNA-binding protein